MKSVYLRLLTILFAFAQVTAVLAEESKATVECNILPSDEHTITHNGVMYMLPEERLTLTFAINESQEIASVTEATILVATSAGQNVSLPLSYELTDGMVTFQNTSFTLPTANVDYTVKVSMTYAVVPPVEPENPDEEKKPEEEKPEYDASRTLVYNAPMKLHLKQTPKVDQVSTPKVYHYAGSNVEANVQTSGGNASGWKYSWNGSAFANSTQYSFTTTSQGDGANDQSFDVVVRNYAPDGATVWFEYTHNFSVYTYPSPIVNVISNQSVTLLDGEEYTIGVETSGGVADTWEYRWLCQGSEIGNTDKTLFIDADNKTLEDRQDNYKLIVQNTLPSGEKYSNVYNFTVIVKGIEIAWNHELPTDVVEGDEIEAAVKIVGANKSTWAHTWMIDGMVQAECTSGDFEFIAGTGDAEGREYELSVRSEIGPGVFEHVLSHIYTVWNQPNTVKTSQDDIALLHGQQYQFAIEATGGIPTGWTYEWFLDDVKINGATAKSYNATMQHTGSGVKHCVYKVIARNTTNGIMREFVETFNAEVWPAVSETHSPEKQDYYYGDDVSLSINVAGGYADGWEYSWLEESTTNTNLGTIVLLLSDSYGDGWNGCGIIVKEDGAQIKSATISSGSSNTIQFSYDPSKEYTFYWTKGNYSSECSFSIKVNGEVVYTASRTNCEGFANGALVYQIDRITETVIGNNSWYNYIVATSYSELSATDEFILRVVNNHPKAPNGPLYEKEIHFDVTGWSHGTVTNMSFANGRTKYRSGDEVTATVTTEGGYPNWTYTWYYNGAEVATTTTPQYTFETLVNEGQDVNEDIIVTISMSDSYGDGWNGGGIVVKQDGVIINTATITSGNSNEIRFSCNPNSVYEFYWTKGSYPGECSFTISSNGEVIYSATRENCNSFTSGELIYVYDLVTLYKEYTVDVMSVVAVNTIPANKHKKESNYANQFEVYAVEEFANDFIMEQATPCDGYNTYAIRSGNALDFYVERATGGYNVFNDSYWYYTWKEGTTVIKSGSATGKNIYAIAELPGSNSTVKRIDTKKYNLEISNIGPYDVEWYNKVYETKVLKIYARPQAPNHLQIKGNGTTNTLICLIDLDDNVLEEREYLFVFGYTDEYGEDHKMVPTSNRWCQMNVSVNDSRKKFWVYSRWNYDDNTYVTSGKRYLDDTYEHDFDASCYNGNEVGVRGTTTDIQNFDADGIYFDGRRLVVDANHSVECIITVTSLDGKNLEINNLGSCSSFDETIDVSKYGRGIYIVRIKVGDKVINRKIVVS